MMNEEEVRRFRINILRQLKAVAPMSLAVPAIVVGARMEAFTIDDRQAAVELDHLCDPSIGFVREVEEKFSRSVKRYKLTAEGREWLAGEGF